MRWARGRSFHLLVSQTGTTMEFLKNILGKLTNGKSGGEEVAPSVEEPGLGTTLVSLFESGSDHVASLCSLFLMEVADIIRRFKGKLVCLIIGLFLLFVGYLLSCVLLVTYLEEVLHNVVLAWACVAGGHVVLGLIFLCIGVWRRLGPLAPGTTQELKNDYECLRIAIKENKNS